MPVQALGPVGEWMLKHSRAGEASAEGLSPQASPAKPSAAGDDQQHLPTPAPAPSAPSAEPQEDNQQQHSRQLDAADPAVSMAQVPGLAPATLSPTAPEDPSSSILGSEESAGVSTPHLAPVGAQSQASAAVKEPTVSKSATAADTPPVVGPTMENGKVPFAKPPPEPLQPDNDAAGAVPTSVQTDASAVTGNDPQSIPPSPPSQPSQLPAAALAASPATQHAPQAAATVQHQLPTEVPAVVSGPAEPVSEPDSALSAPGADAQSPKGHASNGPLPAPRPHNAQQQAAADHPSAVVRPLVSGLPTSHTLAPSPPLLPQTPSGSPAAKSGTAARVAPESPPSAPPGSANGVDHNGHISSPAAPMPAAATSSSQPGGVPKPLAQETGVHANGSASSVHSADPSAAAHPTRDAGAKALGQKGPAVRIPRNGMLILPYTLAAAPIHA